MDAPKRSRNRCMAFLASGHSNFLVLFFTTPISILLLQSSVTGALFSKSFYNFVETNRSTVQFTVQIIANVFATLQILVLCRLINFGVRRYMTRKSIGLDQLRAWNDAMIPRINWDLPFPYTVLLIAFVSLTMIFSAIWAAALTPTIVSDVAVTGVLIPSWENTTFIKEYPSEVGREGPTQQTTQGRFSYSVGIQLLGSILAGATSASPTDQEPRIHAKMDRSRYSFIGRSYGVGASVGLTDTHISSEKLALSYTFNEIGYKADVQCIYNKTSDFRVSNKSADNPDFRAQGSLPDSDNGGEYSTYVGYEMSTIVAIGVAHFPNDMGPIARERKYLAFAAGDDYSFLNLVQCEVNFIPTKFNVTVNVKGQNITVVATDETNVTDIDPSRYLKGILLRQFELIANDETNLYVSMVGQAFNASIIDHRALIESIKNPEDLTDEEINLRGIENSIIVMTDDMLGAYASAQLMISDFKQSTNANIFISALAMGEKKYCIAAFALNTVIILLFLLEAIRTRWWKDLPELDVSDLRHLVIAASEGGSRLGKVGFGQKEELGNLQVKCGSTKEGSYAIMLDGEHAKSPLIISRPIM